jgi:hypothetical protein
MMNIRLLSLLPAIFAMLAIASCGDGPDGSHRDATAQNPVVSGAVGRASDTLTGGASSPRALVDAALAAFSARDTATLAALLITRDEYMRVIYPELGAHFASARDTRRQTMEFLWENQSMNARQGLRKALRELGGKTLTTSYIEFTEGSKAFPSYTIHEGTEVTVFMPDGSTATVHALGSIVEMGGRYKLLSYRDLDH